MKKRKVVNYMIVGITFIIMIWLAIQGNKDSKIKQKNNENSLEYNAQSISEIYNIDNNEKENEVVEIETKQYPKEEVQEQYRGYKVLAKLEIPDIKLETYILKECTEESLNKSVAKLWGANPNEEGNLCIAGHNAPRNRNMFYHLKELEIGNKLTISDNTIGKVEYEIYDIYNSSPEDVSCLKQNTNGEKEVTLITCTNDSQKRTIIKAKEVNE